MTVPIRLAPLRRLLEGAAAGHYTLPAEAMENLATLRRLQERAPTELSKTEGRQQIEMVAATLAAAAADEPLPDVSALLDARRQTEVRELERIILREATEGAGENFRASVQNRATEIVAEHLQPAFSETMAEIYATADVFAEHGNDPEVLLDAPPKARAAYRKLIGPLTTRYDALRAARATLHRAGWLAPARDETGLFAELSNPEELFPEFFAFDTDHLWEFLPQALPWPAGTKDQVLWLVDNRRATAWLPTPDEQDARFADGMAGWIEARRKAAYVETSRQSITTEVRRKRSPVLLPRNPFGLYDSDPFAALAREAR